MLRISPSAFMLEDQNKPKIEEINEETRIPELETLVGFFDLLISVDRRVNPHLYD